MNAAIFTAWQPSAVREQMSEEVFQSRIRCALEFVENALRVTEKVVVVTDDYSSALLQDSRARVVCTTKRGAGITRRMALAAAVELLTKDEPGALLWCEPEKVSVPLFLNVLTKPVLGGLCDVLILKRESLTSYPRWQQPWEEAGSAMFGELIGRVGFDYFFGPRVLGQEAAKIFLRYPNDCSVDDEWDAIHAPLADCVARGLRFGEKVVPFVYPEIQKVSEDHDLQMVERRSLQLFKIISQTASYVQQRNRQLA